MFHLEQRKGRCFYQYVQSPTPLGCSIKVPFVVWELTDNNNNNNNDILIHLLQRKIFNLQIHRLLVHLDTCIYFCLLFLAGA